MEGKLNLWQKINAVMKDVQYLAKDDAIKFLNTSYKAISEEKVTQAVRESLTKHGVAIFPIEQEHIKVDNLTTVNVKYKIINIDNPTESEVVVSSGTGVDTQDKGVGKAMTYAYKYMLLRTFAIPTGEDPDKISSEELDKKLNKQAKQEPKKEFVPNVPAIEGLACSECQTPITAAVKSYSEKVFGKPLCQVHQKKYKEAK